MSFELEMLFCQLLSSSFHFNSSFSAVQTIKLSKFQSVSRWLASSLRCRLLNSVLIMYAQLFTTFSEACEGFFTIAYERAASEVRTAMYDLSILRHEMNFHVLRESSPTV